MSTIAKTIFFYSLYLFSFGLGMMLIPNTLLSLFGFKPTTEIWIRVLGLFTFTTGIYYFQSAKNEQLAFFKATIIGRIFFFLMTFILVISFHQSMMLSIIGSLDLLGALWSLSCLYKK